MNKKLAIIIIVALGLILVIGLVIYALSDKAKSPSTSQQVTDFQSCKDAGGKIAESYPEQCMIDGLSFSNTDQSVTTNKESYIGLTEQEAANKADQGNKVHRVVERDGESLPVTMDYQVGRINFHVKDGLVTQVDVEGEE